MEMVSTARLAVAWLTMFLVGTELFVFSPLLPFLAADYHISAGAAGLLVTVFSLSYTLSAPLFGRMSDRIGRRRVLSGSLLVFAAANLLTAIAPDLASLLAVRLLAGAAAAGISPSIYALVSEAASRHRRGTRLALTASGLLVSLALGATTGAIIGASCGWPTVFIALGGLSVVTTWLNRRVWPAEAKFIAKARAAVADRRAVVALARRLLPMVAWSTSLYEVYTYLGAGLAAAGFSAGQTARIILCYGGGAIAGVVVGGRASDRFGSKFTAGVSLAGLCASLLILRVALDTGTLVELVIGVTSAIAQLFFPAQQAGLANDFPCQRGAALAWNNSALFFGISLGSAIGGRAVAFGNFDICLTVSAGIALIGCVINAIVVPGRTPHEVDRANECR